MYIVRHIHEFWLFLAFGAAWKAGDTLTLEQAIGIALDEEI
jgi:hypothetical protein